jgi:hypothetical protein
MTYFIKYFIPGTLCILLAFVAGSQKSMIFGLGGFLAFFTVGITLIIEGRRVVKKEKDEN